MARKKLSHLPSEPLSAEDQQRLRLPPHEGLSRLAAGRGDGTDWYNVCYRLLNGAYMAELVYTKEVVKFFQEAFKIMEDLYERQKEIEYGQWVISPTDHPTILEALEHVDQMTAEVDRHTQIHAHRKTFARMLFYKKRHDKLVQRLQRQQQQSQPQTVLA